MIKIRLSRSGVIKKPFYRIVAIEENKKGKGRPVDILGYWHPAKKIAKIDNQKLKHWLSCGAQITKAVNSLLKSSMI